MGGLPASNQQSQHRFCPLFMSPDSLCVWGLGSGSCFCSACPMPMHVAEKLLRTGHVMAWGPLLVRLKSHCYHTGRGSI
jgi:hypothetical protein